MDRLQKICDAEFISVMDFVNNPLRIFAAHELAAIIDPAMTVKMTVQFNLFGGTVLKLGTKKHHDQYLKGIDTLNVSFPITRRNRPYHDQLLISSLKYIIVSYRTWAASV